MRTRAHTRGVAAHISALTIVTAVLAAACSSVGTADQLPGSEETSFLSDAEVTAWVYECVTEEGFDVDLDPDSAYGPVISGNAGNASNAAAIRAALRECADEAVRIGIARPLDHEKTEADWQAEYAHRLDVHRCLTEAGYDVETPPPYDDHVESEGIWSPHTAVITGLTYSETEDVFRTCEQ